MRAELVVRSEERALAKQVDILIGQHLHGITPCDRRPRRSGGPEKKTTVTPMGSANVIDRRHTHCDWAAKPRIAQTREVELSAHRVARRRPRQTSLSDAAIRSLNTRVKISLGVRYARGVPRGKGKRLRGLQRFNERGACIERNPGCKIYSARRAGCRSNAGVRSSGLVAPPIPLSPLDRTPRSHRTVLGASVPVV